MEAAFPDGLNGLTSVFVVVVRHYRTRFEVTSFAILFCPRSRQKLDAGSDVKWNVKIVQVLMKRKCFVLGNLLQDFHTTEAQRRSRFLKRTLEMKKLENRSAEQIVLRRLQTNPPKHIFHRRKRKSFKILSSKLDLRRIGFSEGIFHLLSIPLNPMSTYFSFPDLLRTDEEKGTTASDSCSENHWCYSEVRRKRKNFNNSKSNRTQSWFRYWLEKNVSFAFYFQNNFSSCLRYVFDNFLCTQKILRQRFWVMLSIA